ncbi:hypothetical protein ACQCSX_08555 [Pseudarthrobacter sp. P1]|uniref:hypothetical protein n=1 Tax=Pseudarthrobacter sp. P1 TaxID=3418418 RepID=UPI003CEE19FE
MSTVMQWIALGACLACTGWRLPAALKRRNASLFWMFALLSVAVGLGIDAIYLPVDALLGRVNVANLIIRLALYAVFFILATRVAAAYRARRSEWLIRGPVGLTVLAGIAAATVALFLLSDMPTSSTGLRAFAGQPTVQAYVYAGRLYPAYAAAVLIQPTAAAGRTAARAINRMSAWLICAAFAMVVLLTLIQVAGLPFLLLVDFLSYAAILCMAAGMALVWISFRKRSTRT